MTAAPCWSPASCRIARWYELIGDPTLADAILDRVVHNAYRIELSGDSLRKRRAAEIAG